MNTKLTKFLLPLAALAVVSSACDPFPTKPGGDPAVVRVITYGAGDSNTVETVTGGNTVSTDFAWLGSTIRIQFNKPMDGSTIQKYPNYNADGTPFVPPGGADPCTPADGLVLTGFAAGTTVCYDPAAATDGGSAVISPGAPLVYGTPYHVGGTVKDYQGKSLTLNVTITVDQRPLPFAVDGYSTAIDWFDSGTATSYAIEVAPDNAGVPGTFQPLAAGLLPADVCGAGSCEVVHTELVPHTAYWYQIKETTGATTTTRPAQIAAVETFGALTPTLGVATISPDPTKPPQILKGIIRVAWNAVQGVNGYDVEQSSDGTTWTLASHQTTRTYYAGTPAPGTAVPTADGSLTSGNTYYFRVTPTYADAFPAEKGNAASKVAP